MPAIRYLTFAAVAAIMFTSIAEAKDYAVGAIKISAPWTRVTPPASTVGGGFMTITNTGNTPDTLIGGSVDIGGRLELHEMTMEGGIMKMRELKPGLVIKPGETVTLKPGSYHLMFMDLKEPIASGKSLQGTLVFEKAGTVQVEYEIEPIGARESGHGGHAMPSEAAKKAH